MNEIVIFGTSGHAKVVYDAVVKQNLYKVVAFISDNKSLTSFLKLPHFHQNELANLNYNSGIVAVGENSTRQFLVNFITEKKPDFDFISILHPSAQIASDVQIGLGSVIMAGVVINAATQIGKHVIINTSSSIDHDCTMESFSSLAPGVVTGGNVKVGELSAIGLGSLIVHKITIGKESVIGAGSLVIKDVDDFVVAYGQPCRFVRKRIHGDKYL